MLIRLSHVMIFSQKHAEAVTWYCDKLGYEVDYNAPGEYASLHHEKLGRLAIHASKDDKDVGKGALPYFLCDDIRATLADLAAKGVEVGEPKREGESPWFSHFKDLDGNFWGIEEK